jgi:hypothetical protein
MAIRSEVDQFFLALAASHCFWVSSLNPWPLHEFWPLQELLADLQADCPLQALTPVHCTLASSAEAELMGATLNSSAAAAAMAAPEADLVMVFEMDMEAPDGVERLNQSMTLQLRLSG